MPRAIWKGAYVVMSDEEIRPAKPETTQTVDILAFVDAGRMSFVHLDTPYWLMPERRAEKSYALLRDALAESGKLGIASVVMHSRQHLAAVVAAGPALALETLRWSTEVRELDKSHPFPPSAKSAGASNRLNARWTNACVARKWPGGTITPPCIPCASAQNGCAT